MSVKYAVTVIAEYTNQEGDFDRTEELFSITSVNPSRLVDLAPAEVRNALAEATYKSAPAQPIMQGTMGEAPERDAASEEKPKRRRRTNVQIAADKAAAEAALAAPPVVTVDLTPQEEAELNPPDEPMRAPAAPFNPFLS